MYKPLTKLGIVLSVAVAWGYAQKISATHSEFAGGEVSPAPQIQKLYDAFIGTWRVTETFEISTDLQGKTREGTARFRTAPGPSLIEEYQSTGSAGSLTAISFFWWDESSHVYRYLTCANKDGCQLRGSARWEGKQLVNSWEETVDGKAAVFRDSFEHISPSSFSIVSEGKVDGQPVWRVVTKHERLDKGKH